MFKRSLGLTSGVDVSFMKGRLASVWLGSGWGIKEWSDDILIKEINKEYKEMLKF